MMERKNLDLITKKEHSINMEEKKFRLYKMENTIY